MNIGDLRNGVTFEFDGNIFEVLYFMNVPTKRGSVLQTKIKNLRTGGVIDYNFTGSEKIKEAQVEKREMSYLYDDGDDCVFMNNETYEQLNIPKQRITRELNFLLMGANAQVKTYEGEVLGIILPDKVTLEVVDSPMGEKGNSATNTQKDATLETGLRIKVPMFINTGDFVIVNTETGKYDSRAQKK
jgi:elongation factor P